MGRFMKILAILALVATIAGRGRGAVRHQHACAAGGADGGERDGSAERGGYV
ncbi:MAG: hypothetical protein ACLUHE_01935 [Christensenellales bacterium]